MKLIRDVMTTDVSSCTIKDNVFEAATKMRDLNVGAIPIVDEGQKLLGMVTDRDLVVRGYAEKHSGSTAIQEVMSEHLTSVSSDTSLKEASDLMAKKQIRRLPVVDNGKLTGIVALADLAVDDASNSAAGHALEEISEPSELH